MIIPSEEVDVLSVLNVNSDKERELRLILACWHDVDIGNLLRKASPCISLLHSSDQESVSWLSNFVRGDRHAEIGTPVDSFPEVGCDDLFFRGKCNLTESIIIKLLIQ